MSFGIPFFELSFFQQYQSSQPEILERPEMRPDRSRARFNKNVASLIAPRLYLTSLSTATNARQLASLGITHVVSVIEDAPAFPSSPALRKHHVSLPDYEDSDLLQHLPATTSFIRGALAESRNNRVLVHCAMGISRSATVVVAYLIATSQMTPREALAAVRAKRPIVRPNRGFMAQLHVYHDRCSHSLQANVVLDDENEKTEERGRSQPRWDSHAQAGTNTRSPRNSNARAAAAAEAKSYVYSALAALSPTTLSQEAFDEYWNLDRRMS